MQSNFRGILYDVLALSYSWHYIKNEILPTVKKEKKEIDRSEKTMDWILSYHTLTHCKELIKYLHTLKNQKYR